jgi:hypothetical protein
MEQRKDRSDTAACKCERKKGGLERWRRCRVKEARVAGLGTQVVFISPGGILGAIPSMHCRRGVLRWPAVQQDSDRRGRKVFGGDGFGRMGRKARREAFLII